MTMNQQTTAKPKRNLDFSLELLINDIKQVKELWMPGINIPKDEENAIWEKIAAKNKLQLSEAKSIFKVLCKKYRYEASQPSSSWKLFKGLKFLDEKIEPKPEQTNSVRQQQQQQQIQEEETYVELLEVKDEEFSDDESTPKEIKSSDESKTNILLNTKNENDLVVKSEKIKANSIKSNEDENIEKSNTTAQKRKLPMDLAEEKEYVSSTKVSKLQNGFTDNGSTNGDRNNSFLQKDGIDKDYTDNKGVWKYNSFGSYVESTLIRLPARLATKLEIKILQAIIEVNSETMD